MKEALLLQAIPENTVSAILRLCLYAAFSLLIACEKGQFSLPTETSDNIDVSIEKYFRQIEDHFIAEDHEAYIRDYITILEYTQQLKHGSKELMEAQWKLVYYANKMGLYHQSLELIDQMLVSIEEDDSEKANTWKEKLHAARAGCHFELHQYDKALASYHTELHYKNILYGNQHHVSLLNNIGMAMQRYGHPDSAMHYFRKVESIIRAADTKPVLGDHRHDEVFLGSVKDNIAALLVTKNQMNEAESFYQENFHMYRKYPQHPQRLVNAGIQLLRLQIQHTSAAAANTFRQLDSLFSVLQYPAKREQELAYFRIVAQYHLNKGNMPLAAKYQRLYAHLADSLYSAQLTRIQHLSGELTLYKVGQFKRELEQQRRETMLIRQKTRTRFWILTSLVLFSILGGLMLTVSYRQKFRLASKQAKLNEVEKQLAAAHAKTIEQEKSILDITLQQKKKDLSAMAVDSKIYQEWAGTLDGLLSQVEQTRGHLRKTALKKLREEIRSHFHAHQRIDQFRQNIETLSTEFYDHLQALNPHLTKTEIRLVSFLKLRMSNDEIALLQGISTRSVVMSRYRLKKKLGLTDSEDLDTFCQSL